MGSMTKPIATSQRNNQDYIALVEYFEPIIGYSKSKRIYYTYLLNDGFSLSCWEPLCKKIATSVEPFPKLIANIIHREPDTRTIGALLELLSHIEKDEVSIYLYKQVKAHAAITYHTLWGVLVYLGFGNFVLSRPWNRWGYPLSLSIIKDAVNRYWEEEDAVFKVKTNKGPLINIKYKNIEVDIGNSCNNKQVNGFIMEYSNLKNLLIDICSSENKIVAIKQAHNTLEPIFDKLFETYNPSKVMYEFEEYLEELIMENTSISTMNQAYHKIFGHNIGNKNVNKVSRESKLYKSYESLLHKKVVEQKERRSSSNLNILRQRKSSFVLLSLKQNILRERTYDVKFNNMPIFTEWAEYMLFLGDRFKNQSVQATSFILNFVYERHSNNAKLSARDIAKEDLIDFLNDGETSQLGAAKTKEFFSNMIDFLMAKKSDGKLPLMGKLPEPPSINICKNIAVKRPDNTSNRIPLPESVFTEIMFYIDKLDITHKNAFKLIAAGGLRPHELEGITPESLIEKKGKSILCVWEFKKEKTKALKGKKPIREIPLNFTEAIQAFRDQVKESEDARKASGQDSIFIRKHDNFSVYGILGAQQLHVAVNSLIKRHNIHHPHRRELWHYTPYQLRVSLVVEMIENGASDSQLKAFFGWDSESTMQNAYYMARKLKLMEMDTEFFMREFAVNLSQEAIEKYSEDELNEIVEMLYETSREMAYGRCIRHPSQGICGKLHEAASCAPCNHIKVSPYYRKKWEDLYAMQFSELKKLRLYYEQRGIAEEQYEKYQFYIVQAGILESYANVLMNIDKPSIMKVAKWHE